MESTNYRAKFFFLGPVLDFWWHLPWVSKPVTQQSLCSILTSQKLSIFLACHSTVLRSTFLQFAELTVTVVLLSQVHLSSSVYQTGSSIPAHSILPDFFFFKHNFCNFSDIPDICSSLWFHRETVGISFFKRSYNVRFQEFNTVQLVS